MAQRTTNFRAVLSDPADPHQYNENWKDSEAVNLACHGNRILSGFVVSDGGGLTVDVSAGAAVIGRHIAADAYEGLVVPDDSVRWVWLQQETTYTVASGVITDTVPTFQLTAAEAEPIGECALLAEVTTAGGVVTEIVDKRDWANRWVDRTTFKMGDDIFIFDTDTGEVTLNGVVIDPFDPWRPTGVIASTMKREEVTTASYAAIATGALRLDGVWLRKGKIATNIAYWTGTTPAGTPTNWWFALYTYHASAPVLLGQTADQTTTAMAANTKHQLALASPVEITASGLYYIGIMVKATTVPTLRGMSNSIQFINEEVPVRGGETTSTGLTTTAPDPSGAITSKEEFIPYAQVS